MSTPLQSVDLESIEWVLTEARANIAELADDLKRSYEPGKGWPPHIDKATEVLAEIDALLGAKTGRIIHEDAL